MGGSTSRNKGKRAEREVIGLLMPVVIEVCKARGIPREDWPTLQRNTLQSDGGGYDLVGLEWAAIEVKRHEKLCLPAWWRQTLAQARKGQTPILFYRRSREEWKVRFCKPDDHANWSEVPWSMFRETFAHWMLHNLRIRETTNVL